jgi:hypothetical protein
MANGLVPLQSLLLNTNQMPWLLFKTLGWVLTSLQDDWGPSWPFSALAMGAPSSLSHSARPVCSAQVPSAAWHSFLRHLPCLPFPSLFFPLYFHTTPFLLFHTLSTHAARNDPFHVTVWKLGMVVHAYSLSLLGGQREEDHSPSPASAKLAPGPSKKQTKCKRARGLAQVVQC